MRQSWLPLLQKDVRHFRHGCDQVCLIGSSPTAITRSPVHQTQSVRYPMPPSAARRPLPLAASLRRLFFFTMNEAPMNKDEQMASARPTMNCAMRTHEFALQVPLMCDPCLTQVVISTRMLILSPATTCVSASSTPGPRGAFKAASTSEMFLQSQKQVTFSQMEEFGSTERGI